MKIEDNLWGEFDLNEQPINIYLAREIQKSLEYQNTNLKEQTNNLLASNLKITYPNSMNQPSIEYYINTSLLFNSKKILKLNFLIDKLEIINIITATKEYIYYDKLKCIKKEEILNESLEKIKDFLSSPIIKQTIQELIIVSKEVNFYKNERAKTMPEFSGEYLERLKNKATALEKDNKKNWLSNWI